MSQPSPLEIAARAKQVFGAQYHYPHISFRSLGRECFAWARREAKRQLLEEAAEAARPSEAIRSHIAFLEANAWHQPISSRGNEAMVQMNRLAERLRKVLAKREGIAA